MLKIISTSFFCASSVLASPVPHQHDGREHSHVLPSEELKHRHNQQAVGISLPSAKAEQIEAISTPDNPHPHGYFSGPAKLEQLPDPKKKRLLETLIFTDPSGKSWIAPKGHIVDGASIPEIFQPIVGSPFGGKYVMASIIHDVGCDEEKETWQAVHRVFYDAMLASGVEPNKARLMYQTVYEGGPRWGENAEKALSAEAFREMIVSDEYKELITDIKDIATVGDKIKSYGGVGVYSGFSKQNLLAGAVAIYNQTYASIQLGDGKPTFSIGYNYDNKRDGISTENDSSHSMKYQVSVFINDKKPNLSLKLSIGNRGKKLTQGTGGTDEFMRQTTGVEP